MTQDQLNKGMIAFHDGEIGDCLAHLQPFKQLGGGEFYLYRRPDMRLNQELGDSLLTLLECQPYIKKCGWGSATPGAIDFHAVRHHWRNNLNLTDMACRWLGLPYPDRNEPWLTVPNPKQVARVIINRCPRWHNDAFPWKRVVEKYGPEAVFIGLKSEWIDFVDRFGMVSYYYTPSLLCAAEVIKGGEWFIGNQSACHWIAEGTKTNTVLETMPRHSDSWNCHFERANKIHGYDASIELPDL